MFEEFGRYLIATESSVRDGCHVHRGYQILGGQIVRPVTIKRMQPPPGRTPEQASPLVEEGRISARFEHANIVGLIDMDQVDGRWFLAFERVQGQDLSTVVKKAKLRGVTIDAQTALYIAVQILQGLSHAHERTDSDGNILGIVHRDVCPQNVMIGYGGEVKLGNFTYAKMRGRPNPPQPGTPHPRYGHMSPEQALATDVDHRADVFGVGLILYELLSGITAYEARSELDAFARAQRGQVRSLLEVAPTLGSDLREVVEKALIFDRKMRHPSALVFRDELARILYTKDPTFAAYRVATMMARVLGDEATEDRARESDERLEIEKGVLATWAGVVPGMAPSFAPHPATVMPPPPPTPMRTSSPPAPGAALNPMSSLAGYSSLPKGASPPTTVERPPGGPFGQEPEVVEPKSLQVHVPTDVIDRGRPGQRPVIIKDLTNPDPSGLQPRSVLQAVNPTPTPVLIQSPLNTGPRSPPAPPPPSGPVPPSAPHISGMSNMQSIPAINDPMSSGMTTGFVPEPKRVTPSMRIGIAAGVLAVLCVGGFAVSSERNMRLVKTKLRAAVVGRQPGGMLVLDSIPQGAKVIVDGESSGKKTPVTIDNFESGVEHDLRLELEGESAVTSTVSLKPGQKKNLTLIFTDAVVDLVVTSVPSGAEVWVDRRSIGFTPEAAAKVKAGQEINLRITKPGYVDQVKTIVPERRKPVSLAVTLEKTEAQAAQDAANEEAVRAAEDEAADEDRAANVTEEDLDAPKGPKKKKKRAPLTR